VTPAERKGRKRSVWCHGCRKPTAHAEVRGPLGRALACVVCGMRTSWSARPAAAGMGR
jgi:hypothetical protein